MRKTYDVNGNVSTTVYNPPFYFESIRFRNGGGVIARWSNTEGYDHFYMNGVILTKILSGSVKAAYQPGKGLVLNEPVVLIKNGGAIRMVLHKDFLNENN